MAEAHPMAGSNYKSFRLAVILRFLATASMLVTGFISIKVYTAALSKAEFGVILVATPILAYVPLLNFGFRTAINQRLLARTGNSDESTLLQISQVFYSYLSLAVLVGSVFAMWIYAQLPISANLGQSTLLFVAIGVTAGLSFYAGAQSALLVGLQSQEISFLLIIIQSWTALATAMLTVMQGWGIWAFPAATFVGVATSLPVALIAIRRLRPNVKFLDFGIPAGFRELLHELKTSAISCFRNETAIMLMFTSDLVMVGMICGPAEAAVYGILNNLFGRLRGFLQTIGETAWPLIAAKGLNQNNISNPLLRLNAWVYGAVMGALVPTIIPLVILLSHSGYASSEMLAYLFIARNLIVGLWSAAGYFMLGLGQFETLRKYVERELLAAILLALFLGPPFGATGIAVAFLLSTAFGTLFPLLNAFSKCAQTSIWSVLKQIWSRAAVAFVTAALVAAWLTPSIPARWMILIVIAVAASAGLGLGMGLALVRKLKASDSLPGTLSLREIVRQC